MSNNRPRAVIFGCAGLTLTEEEKDFFKKVNPLGFIVFKRNIDTPEQLKALVASLRETVGRKDAPVLIDQEGGRVCRLTPPYWDSYPPARVFGDLYDEDKEKAYDLAKQNYRLIAKDLKELGVNVDCVPDLDFPVDGANPQIMGDRTFGECPDKISFLGKAVCDGVMSEGVLPVLKHIPGHGRSTVDSHFELPVVDADIETLKQTDFKPFKALAHYPWAMTAHVLYSKLDNKNPASLSEIVIQDFIRKEIGFDGFLVCDDFSMKALSGSFEEMTKKAINAGCDAILHCNGNMQEMQEIAAVLPELSEVSFARFEKGQKMLQEAQENATPLECEKAKTLLKEVCAK